VSEDRLERAISRAARAKAILNDEIVQEAFGKLDAELVALWRRTADPIERERAWQAVNLLDKLKANIEAVITNGKLAQAELDQLLQR
jgi:hypothetical protein